jgi:hypothetical protein
LREELVLTIYQLRRRSICLLHGRISGMRPLRSGRESVGSMATLSPATACAQKSRKNAR